MTDSSREYFSSVASRWDEMRTRLFTEEVRRKAISLGGAAPGMTTLDLGAGTGFVSEGLLETGVRVIAVDESKEMLSEAREKLQGRGIIEFREGTAQRAPVEDASVDLVFANMLLHHVDEPLKILKEAYRVLKPGGRAVFTDLDEHNSLFLKTEHHDRWMGFGREAMKEWLHDAGFEKETVVGLDENCCATSASGESAKVGIFAALGKKPLTR